MRRSPIATVFVPLALALPLVAEGQRPGSSPAAARERVWLGQDGQPLPFRTDWDVREFLRTAEVVERQRSEVGINRLWKVVLEKDGIQARAAFRDWDITRERVTVGPRFYSRFRDCGEFECAAYALSRHLGLGQVPPVVRRRLWGLRGSLQIWVEGQLDAAGPEFQPPDAAAWVRQIWDRDLLDNLILNVDRNATNLIVGHDYTLWLIDHTRAFQPIGVLLDPEGLQKINRAAWRRLSALDEEELEQVAGEPLDFHERNALARRRELLLEHVRALVAEKGEAAVFY